MEGSMDSKWKEEGRKKMTKAGKEEGIGEQKEKGCGEVRTKVMEG